MRVLFLDQYSDLGGAQQCFLDLLPAVQQSGWSVHAGVPGCGSFVERLERAGVDVRPIPCGAYSSERKSIEEVFRFASESPKVAGAIRVFAEEIQPDLLYINGPRVLPAAAWAARGRWPCLFHCHHHISQRSAAWLTAGAIRWSGATVAACCRFAAQALSAPGLRPPSLQSLQIVYNGVPDSPVHRAAGAPEEKIRIGVVGRISPEKGQTEFLQAARLLAQALPRCEFAVVGDAVFNNPAAVRYHRSLEELAAGLPVEFLGWRDDAPNLLAGFDLLVVPSVLEPGAPRVILEAYACGVPVVAFPTGGIPEIVQDGDTGFLVRPSTAYALAEKILVLLLRQPDRLEAAAKAGRDLWEERFTIERYQGEMLKLMERAAGAGGGSGAGGRRKSTVLQTERNG